MPDRVVIASCAHIPGGAFRGALGEIVATALGAHAVKAAVTRAGLSPEHIERVYMGCVYLMD